MTRKALVWLCMSCMMVLGLGCKDEGTSGPHPCHQADACLKECGAETHAVISSSASVEEVMAKGLARAESGESALNGPCLMECLEKHGYAGNLPTFFSACRPMPAVPADVSEADVCRCLHEAGDSPYMQANEEACDVLFNRKLGVADWKTVSIANCDVHSPSCYKDEFEDMDRECKQLQLQEAMAVAAALNSDPEPEPEPQPVPEPEVVKESPSTYTVGWDMQQKDPQCREDCEMSIRVVITKDGKRFQNFAILPGEYSDSMVFNHETDSYGECTGEKSGRGILCAAINFSCGDNCYQDLVHVRVKGETLEIHRNEGCMGGSDECLSSDVLAQFPLGPGATVIPAIIQRKPEVAQAPKPTHEVFNTAADVKEPWLNLREGPSGKRSIVGQLPDGTGLIWIAASRGRWAEVKVADGPFAGRTGFLNTKWIRQK